MSPRAARRPLLTPLLTWPPTGAAGRPSDLSLRPTDPTPPPPSTARSSPHSSPSQRLRGAPCPSLKRALSCPNLPPHSVRPPRPAPCRAPPGPSCPSPVCRPVQPTPGSPLLRGPLSGVLPWMEPGVTPTLLLLSPPPRQDHCPPPGPTTWLDHKYTLTRSYDSLSCQSKQPRLGASAENPLEAGSQAGGSRHGWLFLQLGGASVPRPLPAPGGLGRSLASRWLPSHHLPSTYVSPCDQISLLYGGDWVRATLMSSF